MSDYATRIAAAAGDAAALLTLAIELASQLAAVQATAEQMRQAEDERKEGQRNRKRRSRSRDVTGQGVTGRDVTAPLPPAPSLLPPTPPNNSSSPPNPPAIRLTRPAKAPPSAETDAVLAHYVQTHPRRRPGPADRRAVERALGLGYSAGELCEAISGNAADAWHREKKKHDLAYVLRNNGMIDDFRAKAEGEPVSIVNGWFAT